MHVLESFRLDGKVAVVTGGAGLYGRQITEALAEALAEKIIGGQYQSCDLGPLTRDRFGDPDRLIPETFHI